jgi:hypothetical protein
MKVYLAGPMTGIPDYNAPAFRVAARRLRELGHEVISPVELDEEEGFDHATQETDEKAYLEFLRRDLIRFLAEGVEAIVVLPGWEESRGAEAEVFVGRKVGLKILAYPDLEPVKEPSRYRPPSDENVAEEAMRLVFGDRGDDYGPPDRKSVV